MVLLFFSYNLGMYLKNLAILCAPLLIMFPLILGATYSPMLFTLLVLCWMLIWWWSELFPMGIVALIPLIVFPMADIVDLKSMAASYGDPVIFLFLGGFMIARALEKTKLSELLALILLRHLGSSDKGIVIAFITVTAFVSMWVSNTATTMMMIPIASSIIYSIKTATNSEPSEIAKFSMVLMLAISYSSSIGGVITPIGSPPNVVFLGYLNQVDKNIFGFANWFIIVSPVAIAILVMMTMMLLYGPYRFKVNVNNINFKQLQDNFTEGRKLTTEQKVTLSIFFLTVILWVGKDLLNIYVFGSKILNDNTTAIIGGLLLFIIPVNFKKFETILGKDDINKLPWDMILLFGGGIALSTAMDQTGILDYAVNLLQSDFLNISLYSKLILLLILVLTLTEIMSNVALCAVIIPIVMTWAKINNLDETQVGLLTCVVTSFGFAFPMSTPPNALAFATGYVSFRSMLRVGAILNLIGIIAMTTIGYHWSAFIMSM